MNEPFEAEIKLTPEQLGRLLSGAEDKDGHKLQWSIYYPDGKETVKLSPIGDLKPGQEFNIKVLLIDPASKERR